jgi:WD40 repeat protein
VTSTTGSNLDSDGYSLRIDDGAAQALASNGADTVASLSVGSHTVAVAGIASNCVLDGQNPRTIDIAAGSMTRLQLGVACSQAVGAIQLNATTTGDDMDSDGYQVALDGGTPKPVPTNGSTLIGGLTPGDYAVALSDVADNCELAGTNPVTVTVVSGQTANTTFSLTCSALPLVAPGHDIAFGRDGEVYLLSADGSTVANLTNNPSSDRDPAWSPDGRAIAFTSDRAGTSQVYVMNADGSGQAQITSGAPAHNPAWSPDGGKIAFSIALSNGGSDIYVMNPDGSAIAQLTSTGNADSPAWSPDGTRIAFMIIGVFESDIFVMTADGRGVTQLTAVPGIDANPNWSPDGTKIAFNSDRSGERHIHVMNPDGSGVTQLTFGTGSDFGPVWSSEGSKIAFASSPSGAIRLYMMNPDGTEQAPLTPNAYNVSSPAWRP